MEENPMTREADIYLGNAILAEAGLPPMTPDQEKRFLTKRAERLGLALGYSHRTWGGIAVALLGVGIASGYLIGRTTKRSSIW